jgi:Fe-S cluster assembly protein SufD
VSALEAAREHHLRRVEELSRAQAGEPAFLSSLRRDAASAFADRGFPHTKLEEWRYTNVTPIAKVPFEPRDRAAPAVSRTEIESVSFPVFACSLFVFVDGTYRPELSSPPALSGGVRVESLVEVLAERPELLERHLGRLAAPKEHPFAALNTACLRDGAVLTLPAGTRLPQPVHVVFAATEAPQPLVCHPRLLVVAERSSQATVVQDHVSLSGARAWTNAVSEVVVEAGARVELVELQRESDATFHTGRLAARVERDGAFAAHTLTLGGRLVRNDASCLLADEGAECRLEGLFVADDEQLVDNHTFVDHAVPHGTSRELYKGIVGGRARGVFCGRVIVRPDAQKSDAEQSNPNLLLSLGAEVNSKPQLEIHADDVRCSHGSSIGRLDEDALFYLRARGIGERASRELLTRGFASQVLRNLPLPALSEATEEILSSRLRRASGALP